MNEIMGVTKTRTKTSSNEKNKNVMDKPYRKKSIVGLGGNKNVCDKK